MGKSMREARLIFKRNLVRTLRNPAWIVMWAFQPVIYLLLYAPLLGGLRIPGFQTQSLNLFVPGLLAMMALFGASFAGFGVLDDMNNGVIERLRVTPASRLGLLLGMMLHDVFVFLIQCVVLTILALIMGLRAEWLNVALLFVLLALLGLMTVSFSYALTLLIRNQSAVAALLTILMQPLMLLSGVLLPLTLAPPLLQTLAKANPFSYAVDASRALMNGHLQDQAIPLAFGIVGLLTILATVWAVRIFRTTTT